MWTLRCGCFTRTLFGCGVMNWCVVSGTLRVVAVLCLNRASCVLTVSPSCCGFSVARERSSARTGEGVLAGRGARTRGSLSVENKLFGQIDVREVW